MASSPDYILDVQGVDAPATNCGEGKESSFTGRPWLAVMWQCCHVYSRIYRNADATAYHGRCPSCGKVAHARIGAGGIQSRFFTAC